jgi:hypothetical protein
MDILASIFAYLVCITGLVTGLVMSFVVLFAAPGEFQLPGPPSQAVAMVAGESHLRTAQGVVRTIARSQPVDEKIASGAPGDAVAAAPIAIDAQQRTLFSQAHLRRLAEKQRAKQLAYRERSSFETRFLHYDD